MLAWLLGAYAAVCEDECTWRSSSLAVEGFLAAVNPVLPRVGVVCALGSLLLHLAVAFSRDSSGSSLMGLFAFDILMKIADWGISEDNGSRRRCPL